MTHMLIGDAVNPIDILKYIMLFIAVPFAIAIPMGRFEIPRVPKIGFINVMMLAMIFLGIASRRSYIFDHADIVLSLVLCNLGRLFLFGMLFLMILKKAGISREKAIVYDLFAVWRNSGMSISITLALIGSTMPEAALPCIVSLVME